MLFRDILIWEGLSYFKNTFECQDWIWKTNGLPAWQFKHQNLGSCVEWMDKIYLSWPSLPNEVPSNSQGVLIYSNDLLCKQNGIAVLWQLCQVGPNHQRRFQKRPQGKMAPLLIDSQVPIPHLQEPVISAFAYVIFLWMASLQTKIRSMY